MTPTLVTRERIEKALDAHDAAQACLNVMLDLWEDLRPGGPLLLVRREDAEQAIDDAVVAGVAQATDKQRKRGCAGS